MCKALSSPGVRSLRSITLLNVRLRRSLLAASCMKAVHTDKYFKRCLSEPQFKKTITQYALSASESETCFPHMLITRHDFKHADEKCRLLISSLLFFFLFKGLLSAVLKLRLQTGITSHHMTIIELHDIILAALILLSANITCNYSNYRGSI